MRQRKHGKYEQTKNISFTNEDASNLINVWYEINYQVSETEEQNTLEW